jgi:hypothetical protein
MPNNNDEEPTRRAPARRVGRLEQVGGVQLMRERKDDRIDEET